MAKQLGYTDQSGNTYPAAYCMLTAILVDKLNKRAEMTFKLFRDKAARDAQLQPVLQFPAEIANIPATTGSDADAKPLFDTYFSSVVLAAPNDVFKQGYVAYSAQPGNLFAANNATDV